MNRFVKIGVNTLLSGGLLSHGSKSAYVGDVARRLLGMSLAHFQDGAVHYLGKNHKLLERGLIQTAHQIAYGLLRSYPRYLAYWEQVERDEHLKKHSNTYRGNENGQYHQLIEDQKPVDEKKVVTDSIVGNVVQDFLHLSINENGNHYNSKTRSVEPNKTFGEVAFTDLQPVVSVSSKNNIILTTVQGRDYTRKEFVSGGDLEFTISGKITSKYPDIYPEAEVARFLKLMQFKGVIDCNNTILRQFKIKQMIVLNYSLANPEYRNIQPYTISCVAIEPSEAITVDMNYKEKADKLVEHNNKWMKIAKFGTSVIDPSSLLKISRLWI